MVIFNKIFDENLHCKPFCMFVNDLVNCKAELK